MFAQSPACFSQAELGRQRPGSHGNSTGHLSCPDPLSAHLLSLSLGPPAALALPQLPSSHPHPHPCPIPSLAGLGVATAKGSRCPPGSHRSWGQRGHLQHPRSRILRGHLAALPSKLTRLSVLRRKAVEPIKVSIKTVLSCYTKMATPGAGQKAQQLRALVTVPKDPDSISSPYMVAHGCL